MTTMFFAGIPLEGSGSRPLDADLYATEQQAGDLENISATGNLNIGMVIDYDAQAARYSSGSALNVEETAMPMQEIGREQIIVQAMPADAFAGTPYQSDNNANTIQTAALANSTLQQPVSLPELQSVESAGAAAFNPVHASAVGGAISGGDAGPQGAAGPSGGVVTVEGGSGELTIYNTYNVSNVTNQHIEYTQNNYITNQYEIHNTIHAEVGVNLLGGGVGGVIPCDILSAIIHEVFNVTNQLNSTVGTAVNNLTQTLQDVIGATTILSPVTNLVENILEGALGESAPVGGLLGDVLTLTNNIAGDVTNNVSSLLAALPEDVLGDVGSLLQDILALAGDAAGAVGGTLDGVTGLLDSSAVADVAAPVMELVAGLVDNIATGDVEGVISDLPQQLAATVDDALNRILPDISGDVPLVILDPVLEMAAGVVEEVTAPIVAVIGDEPLVSMLGDMLQGVGNPLIDSDLSWPNGGAAAQDSEHGSLLDVTTTLLGNVPQDNGNGLVLMDADFSILGNVGDVVENNQGLLLDIDFTAFDQGGEANALALSVLPSAQQEGVIELPLGNIIIDVPVINNVVSELSPIIENTVSGENDLADALGDLALLNVPLGGGLPVDVGMLFGAPQGSDAAPSADQPAMLPDPAPLANLAGGLLQHGLLGFH